MLKYQFSVTLLSTLTEKFTCKQIIAENRKDYNTITSPLYGFSKTRVHSWMMH